MALKKKKTSKLDGEQLYMLEILVDHLNLCPEKIIDNKEYDLMVRVGFVDLTPVDIIAEELTEVKGGRGKNKENRFPDKYINYEGKTCLFVRIPSNLIRSVKSTPLSVEVYQIPRETDHNLRDNDGQVLLCAATAFLSGYFCDCITAAKDKIDGLSKPYTSTEIHTLIDEQGSPCGSISMHLRLSCFGSSIIKHLTLREKSFVFRGFPFGWKFPCVKMSDKSINDEKNRMKSGDDTFSLLSQILDSATSKSHVQKNRINAGSMLTRPESPPRVSMYQSEFEKLTSAEKLNDRKYRNLIYDTYPDQPTCSCPSTDQSMHPMVCRSGCMRSCCMSLRNPNILKSALSLTTLRDATRDGESVKNDSVNGEILLRKEEYTWRKNNLNKRMKGGSDYGLSTYAPFETTVLYQKCKKTGITPPCRPRSRVADRFKTANCICPGKNVTSRRTGGTFSCTKKPCVGADCMIRAFKEAQEFVDSLGKVQGMMDLGLMDPSESPYFGRDIDKDYVIRETSSKRIRGYPVTMPPLALPNQCTAPCNTQIDKLVVSAVSIPYATSASVTTAIPGRTGVVREAIPSLPDATLVPITVKPKKKEERPEKQKELIVTTSAQLDVEIGPCGEPKCKSRRKISKDDGTIVEESQKKPAPPISLTTISAKGVGKPSEKRLRPRGKKPGPSGDRDTARDPIKVSKRVMRYVYSIGDVYPGTNYGHKNCISPQFKIPANMGWLWNTTATAGKFKPRIGWKPGAIGRYLNELLKAAKGASLIMDKRLKSKTPSRVSLKRGKVYKSPSYVSQTKKEEEETEPPPTLHIHRKDGTYYVTMYPIRQETAEVPQLEEPMKPLQFKIVRNKDDASVASSSTASDMEIEFSPPAAVNRYRRKPDVIHVDTQVRQQEIIDAYKSVVDERKKKEKRGKREKREKK